MTRELFKTSFKKAFRWFPFLDGLVALIIAIISLVPALYDKTAAFAIPLLAALGGFIYVFGTLTDFRRRVAKTREEAIMNILYGSRAIIISALATLIILILQKIQF